MKGVKHLTVLVLILLLLLFSSCKSIIRIPDYQLTMENYHGLKTPTVKQKQKYWQALKKFNSTKRNTQ